MTLEQRGIRADSSVSRAANSVASEETIQELMDGAEVVLAARSAKRKKQSLADRAKSAAKEAGIDMDSLPPSELKGIRLENDEISAAYGQDQSDFQNERADDKNFRSGGVDTNEIAFFNEGKQEYDTIRIPDGVGTESFLAGLDPEEYSAQTVQNMRRAANNVGKSGSEGNVDVARYRPSGKADVPIRIPSGKRDPERKGVFQVNTSDNRAPETAGRDTGGGIAAGNDAASLIRAKLAAGELSLDDNVPKSSERGREQTVRDLLASLDQNAGGKVARDADRAQGRAVVAENQPTSLSQLLKIEENNRLRGMTDDYLERRQRRTQGVLDSLPTLIPGKYAYVRDEGSDDARAMTLQDGTFLVDGGNTANVTGMQRVKLNDYRTVNPDDPSTWQASEMPEAERRVGYDGIRYVGADGADLGDSTVPYNPNTPDTENMLNVGEAPNTVQDLAALEIKKRQSAERMRQVGIMPSLDRVGEAFGGEVPRSLEQLQNMVDQRVAQGGKFYAYDPASPGKSKATKTPTARDILINSAGLSPDEVGNAMQALTMIEAARDTQMPVDASPMARLNHAAKEGFYAGENRGPVPGANPGANTVGGVIRTIPDNKDIYGIDPYADPALLGRNALHHIGTMDSKDRVATGGTDKRGDPIKGEVGPLLRKLQGETMDDLDSDTRRDLLDMARSNQQGTFADEGSPSVTTGPIERRSREQVIRDAQEQYAGYGKPNDTKGILKTANRGLQMEAQIRQTDAQIQGGQAQRAADSSRVEQALQAERLSRGEQVARGSGTLISDVLAERKRRGNQPQRNEFDNSQPIQQAPVQRSIAPDPWAATGSQPVPAVDAGGRFGGGGGKPPKATPALPYGPDSDGAYQGPTRPLDNNLKSALAELNSGAMQAPQPAREITPEAAYAAPETRSAADVTPESQYEGPTRSFRERAGDAVNDAKRFGKRPGVRNTAIGTGALMSVLGLRNLTRNEDNQEAGR